VYGREFTRLGEGRLAALVAARQRQMGGKVLTQVTQLRPNRAAQTPRLPPTKN